MRILDTYKKYKTTPALRSHMMKVAGLANLIIKNLEENLISDPVVVLQACLFHDIAKILSFNNLKENEKEIREEYVRRYGSDEQIAANRIVADIPLSDRAQEIIRNINVKPSLDKIKKIMESDDFGMKVLIYADSRISPNGLVTLQDRLDEVIQRYPEKANNPDNYKMLEYISVIEKQIQEKCKIDLSELTSQDIDSQITFIEETEV